MGRGQQAAKDNFTAVFGTRRGWDHGEDPLSFLERVCAAVVDLPEERLSSFRPSRPIPATSGTAAIYAGGKRHDQRGAEMTEAAHRYIGTYPGLGRELHRGVVAALCDAAYACIGRKNMTPEEYTDNLGPLRELLGDSALPKSH